MGTTSVQAMVEARKSGPFTSVYDFCARLGSGAVNRRGLESLIAAGAFDSLMPDETDAGSWRARLHAAIEPALAQGQRLVEDRLRGQNALFGSVEASDSAAEVMPHAESWPQTELARREKAAIGFYLSTHPLDNYKDLLAEMKLKAIAEFDDLKSGDVVKIAGMITGLQIRTSKRGNRFAQFRFEDRSGGIKGVALGENFNKLSGFLVDDGMFIAEGNIEAAEGQEPTLKINNLKSLDEAEASRARALNITIPGETADGAYFESLYGLLERDRGRCNVFLTMNAGELLVKLEAGGLSVAGSRSLQRELETRGCTIQWIH